MLDFTGTTNTNNNNSQERPTMNSFNIDFAIDPFHSTDWAFASKIRALAATFRKLELDIPEQLMRTPFASPGQVNELIIAHAPTAKEDHLDKAAQALANGEDPIEHLINHNAWSIANQGELKARVFRLQRQNHIDLLHQHADSITRQIRTNLFSPAIRALKELLKAHPGKQWNLETAVNAGDYTHAAIIKDSQKHANTLAQAVQIRADIYSDKAFTTDATWVTAPGLTEAVGKAAPDSLTWWMNLLAKGYEPHFPTASEWHTTNNSKVFTQHQKEAADLKAAQNPEVQSVAPAANKHRK